MTTAVVTNSVFRGFFEKQKLTGSNFIDWYKQLRIVLSVEDKLDCLEQPIPSVPIPAQAGQQVVPEALATHTAWVKGSKEIAGLMLTKFRKRTTIKRNRSWLLGAKIKGRGKNKKLSQGAIDSGIFTIELYTFPDKSWVYDTGCGTHICNTTQGLRGSRKLKPRALSSYVGNGQRAVEAIGTYHLCLPSGLCIVLNNCHYAPSITREIISVSRLHDDGYVNCFVDNANLVSRNNLIYFSAVIRGGIFKIDLSNSNTIDSSMYSNKKAKLNLDSALMGSRKLKPRALSSYVGNGQRVVEAIGTYHLCLPSGLCIVLNNCHYAPSITREIISVSRLHDDGYVNCFVDNANLVSRNNLIYFSAVIRGGIFKIDLSNSNTIDSSIKKRIEKLQHDGILNSTDLRAFKKCVSRDGNGSGLGYPKETIGNSFYYPPENKVLVAQNAKFLENSLITQEASGSLEELEIIQEEDTHPSIVTSLNHEDYDLEIKEPQSDIIPIRRSIRTRHAPYRMCLYIDAEVHELGDLGEPANYKVALLDPESDKWLNAMNVEMQSMKDNKVWDLVDLPSNGKTVGSKWLFKKKTDIDEAIHTFTTRLVAKGFTQTYGVDYEETFSPVVDIKAIRIFISIAMYYDYEIWQIDVKNVFLNRHLSEEVYMEQPEASGSNVTFLILYVDDILIMGNHIPMLQNVKSYLGRCFAMKDLVEAAYILGIKIYRDRSQRGVIKRKLRVSCYTNAGYLTDADDLKSHTRYVVILNRDNESVITKGVRHFCAKVHYLREVIEYGDIKLERVHTDDNLADPFTKALAFSKHSEYTRNIGMLPASSLM
nr:hypothetical protein [Tanacetum cinerariifolium]